MGLARRGKRKQKLNRKSSQEVKRKLKKMKAVQRQDYTTEELLNKKRTYLLSSD